MQTIAKQVVPHVRWMIMRDLPEVLNIDSSSFGAQCWKKDDFIAKLRNRDHIGMVAEIDEVIVGFIIYRMYKHSFGVVRLATHCRWRRRGIGSYMLSRLKPKLHPDRRTTIRRIEPDANLVGHLFLRHNRFVCTDIIKPEKNRLGDDAYLFEFSIK